jgi:hypothetical protein
MHARSGAALAVPDCVLRAASGSGTARARSNVTGVSDCVLLHKDIDWDIDRWLTPISF